MGSYNYLGFAENNGPRALGVENVIKEYGVGVGTTRHEIGKDGTQEIEIIYLL